MGARDGRISRCGSCRRRSTRNGPGPEPWFTCTSPKRRFGPGPGWPGSKTSGRCCCRRLRQVLGTRCQIQLKPVIDVNDQPAPVDSYEIPARIAEHLRLRQPADVFPYAAGGSRRTDLDHTIPTGPPTRAARPVRPRSGTSDPWPATTTGSKPTAAGTCDNPNPAPGSGGRLTDASSWSTAPVPTRSANPVSPNGSGAPPKHHQSRVSEVPSSRWSRNSSTRGHSPPEASSSEALRLDTSPRRWNDGSMRQVEGWARAEFTADSRSHVSFCRLAKS